MAYCDEDPIDPVIPGIVHHFTTYSIENERCAEEKLHNKAVSNICFYVLLSREQLNSETCFLQWFCTTVYHIQYYY